MLCSPVLWRLESTTLVLATQVCSGHNHNVHNHWTYVPLSFCWGLPTNSIPGNWFGWRNFWILCCPETEAEATLYNVHAQITAMTCNTSAAQAGRLDEGSAVLCSGVCLSGRRISPSVSSGWWSRSCIWRGEYDAMKVRGVSENFEPLLLVSSRVPTYKFRGGMSLSQIELLSSQPGKDLTKSLNRANFESSPFLLWTYYAFCLMEEHFA